MRTMKNSGIEWIGEIPQDWGLRKIKTNFDIIAGATPKSGEASYWDGDIPWITPADYTTEGIYVSAGHKSITQDGLNSCATSLIPEGSIIFSKRAPVGLVAINSNPLCTNQGCLSCIPKESVDAKYYYYVMSIYGEQFDLFASGTTFKEISADAFANFKLPYPDFETQKRITSFLDAKCTEIDALIAAKEKTNALLKERRQSIIYEAVTKGLDPTVPMKDSGVEWIGKIPSAWRIIPLSKVSERMNNGYVGPTRNIFVDSGVRYLQSLHIKEGQIIFDKAPYYVSQEWAEEHSLGTVHTGDVLIVQTGDIGQVACVPEEYNECNCHALIIITPKSRFCLGDYLSYLLQSHYGHNQLLSCRTGALHPHLNSGNIGPIKLPFPPLNEQRDIVSYLKKECQESDYTIRLNDMTIEMLRKYRQSLIYEAVTGKIEI